GVPPHAREDVLDDLLRELAVAEAVDGEAVQLRTVGPVQGPHRVLALRRVECLQDRRRHTAPDRCTQCDLRWLMTARLRRPGGSGAPPPFQRSSRSGCGSWGR